MKRCVYSGPTLVCGNREDDSLEEVTLKLRLSGDRECWHWLKEWGEWREEFYWKRKFVRGQKLWVSDEPGPADTVLITVRIFDFMLKAMGSNGSKRLTWWDINFQIITMVAGEGKKGGKNGWVADGLVVVRVERSCNPEVWEWQVAFQFPGTDFPILPHIFSPQTTHIIHPILSVLRKALPGTRSMAVDNKEDWNSSYSCQSQSTEADQSKAWRIRIKKKKKKNEDDGTSFGIGVEVTADERRGKEWMEQRTHQSPLILAAKRWWDLLRSVWCAPRKSY